MLTFKIPQMKTIDEEKNERDKLVHFEEEKKNEKENKEDKKDDTEKLMEKKDEAEIKA